VTNQRPLTFILPKKAVASALARDYISRGFLNLTNYRVMFVDEGKQSRSQKTQDECFGPDVRQAQAAIDWRRHRQQRKHRRHSNSSNLPALGRSALRPEKEIRKSRPSAPEPRPSPLSSKDPGGSWKVGGVVPGRESCL
jgi:hypothetical protein